MYYIFVENDKIIGSGEFKSVNDDIQSISVAEELYNSYNEEPLKYIFADKEIKENPEYANEQRQKRISEFQKDFFNTSLGNIRRKVTMKTGEIKDFLTDLLPVISLGVQSGQTVNIITYNTPDFSQNITNWEILQEVKQATPEFIQECFEQVNKDFTGI